MNLHTNITKNIIGLTDQFLMLPSEKLPVGLFYGKMGISIYYYYMAEKTGSSSYQDFADKLLDEIWDEINETTPIDFDTGLSGISWGVMLLVESGFLQGNIDEVLKQIDDKIFHDLNFYWLDKSTCELHALLRILMYVLKKCTSGDHIDEKQFIYHQLIIKTINKIENMVCTDDFEEPYGFDILTYQLPFYLYILAEIYKKNIYMYKIEKIWDELTGKILSTIPRFHTNRLYLLSGMNRVSRCVPRPEWETHMFLLEKYIDLENIISKELKNKSIFARNGLTGCFWLLRLLDDDTRNRLTKNKMAQLEKFMQTSTIWKEEFCSVDELYRYAGIMNGFAGVGLTGLINS